MPAEEVVTRYQAGESLAILAKAYGTNTGTVRNLLLEQDVVLRSPSWKFGKDGTGGWRGGIIDMLPVSQIIADCRDGATLAQLAEAHDVSVSTIVKLLDSRGGQRRSSRNVPWKGKSRVLTSEQEDEVLHQYEGGESQAKIARDFGVSREAVRNVLRHRGLLPPKKPKKKADAQDEGDE